MMDVQEDVRYIWDSLLTTDELKLKSDCDDIDAKGLFLLLQVFSSQIKSFVSRCVSAEESLDVALQRCSRVEAKCFELHSALGREKTKVCSQCTNLQQQLESQKKSFEEKTKPCFQCPKLQETIKEQQLKIDDGKAKLESVFEILKPSSVPKEKRRSTAFDAVSQMLDGVCEQGVLAEKNILAPKSVVDAPKRKSEELDVDGPKRKSPCTDKESVSPVLGNLVLNKDKSREASETPVKSLQNEQLCTKKSEMIIVPETLDDEYFNPINTAQNIIIPETCYTQVEFDHFHLHSEKLRGAAPEQEMNGDGNTSPILNISLSKKPENSTGLSLKSHAKQRNSSVSTTSDQKEKSSSQNDAFQLLDEIFDEIDVKTATSLKIMKSTTSDTKKNKDKKVLVPMNSSSNEYKRADFRKKENVWILKKSENAENEPQSEDSIIKKMKQTTLAVVTVPKKQDISVSDSFCGGVLSAPLEVEDENMDSDDSECLVLPSPKSTLSSSTSRSCNLKKLDDIKKENVPDSNALKTETCFSSLDDTYFAPPVTSTCFSGLGKITKEKESGPKAAGASFKKPNLENSFDIVPNRSPLSPKFKYKEETVRKKDERQRLPGWDCQDCAKYYMFAARNGNDPQVHKNKCSRHRSKHRDLNKTVEGYWDPCIPDTQDVT